MCAGPWLTASHAQVPVAPAATAADAEAGAARRRNAVVVEDGERAPARPAPVAQARRQGFDLDLQFEPGSSRMREENRQVLALLAHSLKSPGQQLSYFLIESYTDELGHPARNLKLSQERADAVRKVLIASGVAPTRLVAAGRGAGSPEDEGGPVHGRRIRIVNLD